LHVRCSLVESLVGLRTARVDAAAVEDWDGRVGERE